MASGLQSSMSPLEWLRSVAPSPDRSQDEAQREGTEAAPGKHDEVGTETPEWEDEAQSSGEQRRQVGAQSALPATTTSTSTTTTTTTADTATAAGRRHQLRSELRQVSFRERLSFDNLTTIHQPAQGTRNGRRLQVVKCFNLAIVDPSLSLPPYAYVTPLLSSPLFPSSPSHLFPARLVSMASFSLSGGATR